LNRPFIVAIDGPSGAGKSTASKMLARRLNLTLVDTGAIYRCVALQAARHKVSFSDDVRLAALLPAMEIQFRTEGDLNRVYLGGEDVTEQIRTPEVSMGASQVSARPVVREGLLDLQRRFAREAARGAVLEGRDIGTVVFPDADIKFFLTADPEVRARRRHQELAQKGSRGTVESVLAEQSKRDHDDASRAVAPLRPAADAIVIDSSAMSISEVVEQLEREILAAKPRVESRFPLSASVRVAVVAASGFVVDRERGRRREASGG
jgi:cytidylate kinase